MIANIFWLVISLALILIGANILTDGASAIAKRLGISDLIIGLTVVAFGTSTPELVISVVSAVNGNAAIAVGNIVGSNILNILLILGITALIRPIKVKRTVMTNEIPMVLLSSLILLVFGYSAAIDRTPSDVITRIDGIMLLIFFALFMRYTFASARHRSPDADDDPASADGDRLQRFSTLKSVFFIIAGLAALIYGGDRFVGSASGIAMDFGVSEAMIGLTIVAIGTSLPELATSVVAAIKNKPGIAIGNVIGSNIFNILLILGTAATITPLQFAGITHIDLWTLVGASFIFWLTARAFGHRTINRTEGALMLICYGSYMAYLIINA